MHLVVAQGDENARGCEFGGGVDAGGGVAFGGCGGADGGVAGVGFARVVEHVCHS